MRRLILYIIGIVVTAMGAHANPRYCARYVKEHLLYQRGAETNVIDIDMEWPEMVDGAAAVPLQRLLTRTLLGNEHSTLDSAYTRFLARFGKPVTRQFDSIPDDSRFCYVSCTLKLIGHRTDSYISMRASYVCSPEQNSTQKGDTVSMLVTYDLGSGTIMRDADLLRINRLRDGYYGDDVVYNLLAGTHTPLPENIYTLQVNDACLADDALLIDMCCTDGERITPFTTLVAPDRIRSIVTKNVKRLMSGSVTLLTDQYMLPTRVDGDTVYTHADQAPRFDFNGESLMNYLARNLRLDPVAIERLPAGARAVIAFIVDASGHIRRPCVVSSATPGIDRELMRAARLMPAWAPGTVGGKPANVWCMLPIVLKK